jgi:hypothetical protein
MIHSTTLPTYLLERLEGILADLGRKARKLNVTEPSYKVIKEYTEEIDGKLVSFSDISISYEIIQIPGWRFLASVETVDYVGDEPRNRVLGYGISKEVSDQYITIHQNCDHCQQNRKRNQTYIIQNGDKVVQVGSSCLKDYMGIDPTNALGSLDMGNIIEAIGEDESWGHGNNAPSIFDINKVTPIIVSLLSKNGFVSASAAEYGSQTKTADDIRNMLLPTNCPALIAWQKEMEPTQENIDTAKMILERLSGRILETYRNNPTSLDEFSFKIGLCLNRQYLDYKDFQLFSAAVNKEGEFIAKERIGKDIKRNEFFPGAVEGQKIDFSGTIHSTKEIATQFGTSILVMFISESGHVLKNFYSGKKMEFNIGSKVNVKGTVKKLEASEKYGHSVLLTRIKIVP